MALNSQEVLAALRTQVAGATGLARVYGQGDAGANRIPAGVLETPCAVITRGPTNGYVLREGNHYAVYNAYCYVLCSGADDGEQGYAALALIDDVIEKLALKIKLDDLARVTYCRFVRDDTGWTSIEWGGSNYLGHRLVFEIREDAAVTPAT